MSIGTYRFILAILALGTGTGLMVGLFFSPVPEANQRVMDLATGIILGWGSLALGFYFGSSQHPETDKPVPANAAVAAQYTADAAQEQADAIKGDAA